MTASRLLAVEPADLAITGVSRHLASRRAVLEGVLWGAAASVLLLTCGVVSGPAGGLVALAAGAGAGCAGTVVSLGRVSRRARALRHEFDMAVAVLLDLVTIQLAGGAGLETALLASSNVGDGWAFDALRSTLGQAQASRRSYWDALVETGRAWGVSSLVEVAHSARLAGEHGARIRATLASKAAMLRARNLAVVEHDAQQRTEQMGLPMILLFLAFLVFVGYPAMSETLGSF